MPSANMHCNARSLAKLGAFMANKGSFKGQQLITEEAWNQLHGDEKIGSLGGLPCQNINKISKGGLFFYNKEVSDGKFVFDRECYKYRDDWWGW